jgi:hypothetical protein
MLINVTEDDIRNGQPSCSNSCPVALALRRQTKREWFVGREAAQCYYPESYGIIFPSRVTFQITRFDLIKHMEPFDFEIPDDYAR